MVCSLIRPATREQAVAAETSPAEPIRELLFDSEVDKAFPATILFD